MMICDMHFTNGINSGCKFRIVDAAPAAAIAVRRAATAAAAAAPGAFGFQADAPLDDASAAPGAIAVDSGTT